LPVSFGKCLRTRLFPKENAPDFFPLGIKHCQNFPEEARILALNASGRGRSPRGEKTGPETIAKKNQTTDSPGKKEGGVEPENPSNV